MSTTQTPRANLSEYHVRNERDRQHLRAAHCDGFPKEHLPMHEGGYNMRWIGPYRLCEQCAYRRALAGEL